MSRSPNPSIRFSPMTFGLLRDLVHERMGLYFDDSKSDLFFSKLSPLVIERGFDSLLDYYYGLKDDSASATEWWKLFEVLTVQESFFWREMEQVHALVREIVPRYFKAHPQQTLNIWSAACAAGEEPLTIAMALQEAGWFERAKIDIYASDASPRAIDAARRGVYRERSFRSLSPDLKEKYFARKDATTWKVADELHSRIRWRTANLMAEADIGLAAVTSPVIFCRNVFIYFSESATRKTVHTFAERMPKPGYLFVGAAESLLKITSRFELQESGDAFVYVMN